MEEKSLIHGKQPVAKCKGHRQLLFITQCSQHIPVMTVPVYDIRSKVAKF